MNVEIEMTDEPGTLSMTVASNSTSLTETETTATTRTFTGALPTVTVTDSRVFPERLDPGAYWYVLGSSGAFVGDSGQPDIDPENLGWTPELLGGTGPDEVIAGDEVAPVLDTASAPDNVGLVDQELLASAVSSQGNNPPGSWTVGAAPEAEDRDHDRTRQLHRPADPVTVRRHRRLTHHQPTKRGLPAPPTALADCRDGQ